MLKELFHLFTPYEWIITNRLGGYALGNAFLANSRKYHGLLIAGRKKGERIHLVSSVEEKVTFLSGLTYFLDTNFYRDITYPEGYKLIKEFFYLPYPSFYFACPQSKDFFLKKSIKMHKEKNLVLITYQNISTYPFKLEIRPKFSFRNHHTVQFEKDWKEADVEINIFEKEAFVSKNEFALFIYLSKGKIFKDPIFYYHVYYPIEEIRGYEATEDLFSPFKIEVDLNPAEKFYLIFSDIPVKDINKEIELIESYYRNYPELDLNKKSFSQEEYFKILDLMVESFLLEDDIVAGFPWFYCWGRDTFIGLPAIFYLEKGFEKAYTIFIKYKNLMKNGLIPNVVTDFSEINYNSIDGTLWFGLRIFQFIEFFKDKISEKQKNELLQAIKEIITQFLTNSFLPFRIDPEDGFIEIPDNINLALTWMDVVIDGIPITPRYGKPIEISALWYNLLKFSSKYLEEPFIKKYNINSLIRKQKKSFAKYFNGELWADRIYKKEPIFEIRPNYIIALSLPYDIADKTSMTKGLELAKKELLTSYGLRSLSPRHPNFRKNYFGSQYLRDLAYHNGTVWVWLLYPYAEVLKKVYKNKKILKEELNKLVKPFRDMIISGKIASIPELYDGENPYYPKGAHAQFWSVASIYLIEKGLQTLKGVII
ncbi:Amylo-alpha-16-glucosidase [Thermodesulfobacterium geofontis OPF15]|jgi:predicted glycogen debranching enzyme|uniref:Amylo-alpha-16-glucosidase n=1 Tax=Thermodesulfobacterium geofontis (strain OPF15) TaxID=795359 RepID=F8C386_THEGP|nr:amylo-alpha-1,6-glucosidase [Thermodesulfobacterium geofontis]AEH22396.1 Amylo-alpha-16-glucosidase [Thermodesulfobacterium geofontis OPF15]